MFGSETLEVGTGVIFFFLLVSLMCTAAREAIESLMRTRAMDLERGVRELLADAGGRGITSDMFAHPMLFSLFAGKYDPERLRNSIVQLGPHMAWGARRNLPSYIPSGQFAAALLDIVGRGPVSQTGTAAPLTVETLRAAAANFPNEQIRRAILLAIDNADGDLKKVQANVETWFDGTMNRVSGWYKRRTQFILFILGFLAAVLLNLDAITVAKHLALDRTLRQTAIAEATAYLPSNNAGAEQGSADEFVRLDNKIRDIGYPIGWGAWLVPGPQSMCVPVRPASSAATSGNGTPSLTLDCPQKLSAGDWLAILLGWVMTALAVMLGAPFWFDILSKVMTVRSGLASATKSPPGDPANASPAPAPPPAPVPQTASAPAVAFTPHQWATQAGDPHGGIL